MSKNTIEDINTDDLHITETTTETNITPVGVSDEILSSANKTVDAILEFGRIGEEKEAKGETWPHREKFPEPFWPLLDTYVRLTGQKPLKSKVSDWLLTAQDWLDLEIQPVDLQMAYAKSKPEKGDGFTVARPGSLTNTAGMFAGERRSNGAESGLSLEDRIVADLQRRT